MNNLPVAAPGLKSMIPTQRDIEDRREERLKSEAQQREANVLRMQQQQRGVPVHPSALIAKELILQEIKSLKDMSEEDLKSLVKKAVYVQEVFQAEQNRIMEAMTSRSVPATVPQVVKEL